VQAGRTRYTHYTITYHLVWIPKCRRKILTGEVQAETKRLLRQCCERHGLTLLALETDSDHVHVFVSAPPRCIPALIANLLKGDSLRGLRAKFPPSRISLRVLGIYGPGGPQPSSYEPVTTSVTLMVCGLLCKAFPLLSLADSVICPL